MNYFSGALARLGPLGLYRLDLQSQFHAKAGGVPSVNPVGGYGKFLFKAQRYIKRDGPLAIKGFILGPAVRLALNNLA